MLRNGQGRNMDRFKSAMAQAKKMQQYCELKVKLQNKKNTRLKSKYFYLKLESIVVLSILSFFFFLIYHLLKVLINECFRQNAEDRCY